jgi:hypothetical protein
MIDGCAGPVTAGNGNSPMIAPDLASLAGVTRNRQKTDDLHRDDLHEGHRGEGAILVE